MKTTATPSRGESHGHGHAHVVPCSVNLSCQVSGCRRLFQEAELLTLASPVTFYIHVFSCLFFLNF